MIDDLAGVALRGIWGIVQWLLVEVVFTFLVGWPGYAARRVFNKQAKFDESASFVVGISMWVIVIGIALLVFR